jgi:hypothetical protein
LVSLTPGTESLAYDETMAQMIWSTFPAEIADFLSIEWMGHHDESTLPYLVRPPIVNRFWTLTGVLLPQYTVNSGLDPELADSEHRQVSEKTASV